MIRMRFIEPCVPALRNVRCERGRLLLTLLMIVSRIALDKFAKKRIWTGCIIRRI